MDEAVRDDILVKRRRRRDVVASRGSSFLVSWTGEPLNILSRGLFPRDMVTAHRSRTVLPLVDISRGRGAALPLSSQSTSPADRGFSSVIGELAGDIFGRSLCH